jgi:hypothetical protein
MPLTQVQPGMLTGNNPAIPTTTAVGTQALNSNSAANNTAVGFQSLFSNTTGDTSTAVGYRALYSNTTGTNCNAFGKDALYSSGSGVNNTAIGDQAGRACTGSVSTFVGANAGVVATGSSNTFIGCSAGEAVTSGASNTILGRYNGNQSGLDIRTASNYIVLSDGGGNPRLWSDNTGKIVINNPAVLDGSRLTLQMSSGDNAMSIRSYDSSTSVMMLQFYTASNSRIGFIQTVGGTSTTFSTSSDYRLKENVAPMTGALDRVAQLKPVTYKWKSNGSDGQGFIAHELAEVVPDCVVGEKDAVDAEGNPEYQGIDTSFLVATLTAAIQELNAKVDAQAAEIATLKAVK